MQVAIKKRVVVISLVVIVLVAALLGFAWWREHSSPNYGYKNLNMEHTADVADNLAAEPTTSKFGEELDSLDFYTFLHGKGPFTVFAPTDQAYNNLPANDRDLMDNDDATLRQFLLYNIVKGSYKTSDFYDGMVLHSIQGDDITVTKKGDSWALNGRAYIQTADIVSKNGVIHLTTNYLIPPSMVR